MIQITKVNDSITSYMWCNNCNKKKTPLFYIIVRYTDAGGGTQTTLCADCLKLLVKECSKVLAELEDTRQIKE